VYGEEQGIARVGGGGHTCAYLTRHDGSPRLLCLTLVAFSTAGRPYHTEFATVPFGGQVVHANDAETLVPVTAVCCSCSCWACGLPTVWRCV